MSAKKIKNNDIKNILKESIDEKNLDVKYYLFEPILKQNKQKTDEKNKNFNYQTIKSNLFSNKEEISSVNKNSLIIRNKEKSKIFIKSKTSFNTPKTINNINTLKPKNNIKIGNKFRTFEPFVTSVDFKNIQTNEEESKNITNKFKSKKNNLVCFGKSLNQILINNINEAIIKKGNIIKKKKRKNFSSTFYKPNIKNFNNYEMHMRIFDDKLIEMYEDFQKKQKLIKKQRLNHLLPDLEEKRKKVTSRIPLSIKGYKKNEVDIFYTRNICDLDYQKYYMKEKINMNDILENHNKYNRKDYLSGKVPFFMLTKSVVKPSFKKSYSQKNIFPNYFNPNP